MAELWFVRNEDESVEGPFAEKDISIKLLSGEISDRQSVRQGAHGEWCTAKRARVVFEQLAEQGWYVRADDEIFGPFTDHRIRELHQTNGLGENVEVRRGTKMPWQPADSLSLLRQQQKAPSTGSQPKQSEQESVESIVPPGAKWSTEPMRHVFCELREVVGQTAARCEARERLLLQERDGNIVVLRSDQAVLGMLPSSDAQQILNNSTRGIMHITLLDSPPSMIPVRIAIVFCPPGIEPKLCRDYIDEHLRLEIA